MPRTIFFHFRPVAEQEEDEHCPEQSLKHEESEHE